MNIVEEAKRSVKQKNKEANAMKNKTIIETSKTILLTVALTLLLAGPFIFYFGTQFGKSNVTEVQKQAKEMVSSVNVDTPSKQ